jgi:hypothetical protein
LKINYMWGYGNKKRLNTTDIEGTIFQNNFIISC